MGFSFDWVKVFFIVLIFIDLAFGKKQIKEQKLKIENAP